MNKNAIVLSCSYLYLLGLHSILNAIEYFNIKADVHIGTHDYLYDYINYAKTKFSYNIVTHNVTELGEHSQYHDSDFVWGKYRITDLISKDYDGIMYNDCDCMIVDNITPYLDFAANTDYILITNNVFSGEKFDRIFYAKTEEEIERLCLGHTIKNFVCFFNVKSHINLIRKLWEERNNSRLIENSTLETYFFNRLVHDLNKDKLIVPLPGSLWQADKYLGHYPISMELHGRYKLVNCHNDAIQVIHNRCWNVPMERATIAREEQNKHTESYELMIRVMTETRRMFDFLSNYKFTIEEAKNINEKYKTLINNSLLTS